MENEIHTKKENKKKITRVAVAAIWIAIIVLYIINRDRFTIEGIISMTPKSVIPAVLALWSLYAVKSLSFFMYSGILSAASGVLFPLYFAIPVSLVGVAIMVSVPYFLGKKLGSEGCNKLLEKYPKLQIADSLRTKNSLLFCFAIRIIGTLPSDPLSTFCGAMGVKYSTYLLGSILGMLPETLAYTIAGMSLSDSNSPMFVTAVAIRISFFLIGAYLNYRLYRDIKNDTKKET